MYNVKKGLTNYEIVLKRILFETFELTAFIMADSVFLFVVVKKKKMFLKMKNIINGTLKTGFFISQIIVPLWVLVVYSFSFSWLLPTGVNSIFAMQSGTFFLLLASVLSLAYFIFVKISKFKLVYISEMHERILKRHVIFLLLPLTPVVQYILYNYEILNSLSAAYVFFVFTLAVVVFVLVFPFLLRRFASLRTMMFLGSAYLFTLTYMALLSRNFAWHEKGNFGIQLLVFVISFLLIISFQSKYENVPYYLIVIFFLSSSITPLFTKNDNSKTDIAESENVLSILVDSRHPVVTPNIYLMIYDAYVGNETMISYGIDNQLQENYLEELGFEIYPETYSIGCHSIGTMSRVLNASSSFYGDSRKGVSGDGVVINLLQGFGYETYGIFTADYYFRGTKSYYDYSFPQQSSPAKVLIKAILMGEFQFDIGFDEISNEQFLAKKYSLFSIVPEQPRFIYMHSKKPGHSQNSGACLPNEVELFSERLQDANIEMKRDIELIIANDKDAIIVIAGDHGPYLTKNCTYTSFDYDSSEISRLDIQDRYGSFLAIRWPSQNYKAYDDITVLQDIFPSIFAYMFQNAELLNAKVDTITLDDYDRFFSTSRVIVKDGVIKGGINDGESLFVGYGK